MSALFKGKVALARAVGELSRRSGRGGGTTLPGRLLVRMAPDTIDRLAAGLTHGSIVVSSTNGKTTTAGMIAGILRSAGRIPVHNRAGSNMHWGVATALLEQAGDDVAGLQRGLAYAHISTTIPHHTEVSDANRRRARKYCCSRIHRRAHLPRD